MTKLTKFAPTLIIFAAILWGFDGILRRSLFQLPPIIIVFYEHLIGALIIFPFFIPKLKLEQLTKKEYLALIWIALVSGLLGTLWFTTALSKVNFIPFSVVFLLQKLQPVFAISTAAVLLKEKITKSYLKWAALAIAAAYFVTFKNGVVNLETGSQTIVAALFALGAAFAWGSTTAVSRYALLNRSTTTITGFRFIFTTIFSFIAVFLLNQQANLSAPTQSQIARLVFIALSTGLVALWIYYKGLKFTQAKISTIVELAFPLTAVIIDLVFYQTVLSASQYLAATILLYAIYQISKLNLQKA